MPLRLPYCFSLLIWFTSTSTGWGLEIDPHGLVKIHVLLFQLVVVYGHAKVIRVALGIRLAER